MTAPRSRLAAFQAGIGWGGLSVATVAVFQVLFLAVMARLLTPADFGIIAIANLLLRFLSYFSQLGVVPALIQKQELTASDVAAALSVSLAVSVVFALIAIACAPLAAAYFAMPALQSVTQALALNFVLTGFASISTALLRRSMRFRELAIIDSISYVVGFGLIGLGLGFAGAGLWSLAGASIGQTVVMALLSYRASRHSLSLSHEPQSRRHFFNFGAKYSLIGFCEFLSGSFDVLAIGKTLGEASAGVFNRAATLANLPVQQPATVMIRVLFPVLTSAGAERAKQAIGLQLGLLGVGCFATMVLGVLVVGADATVRTLLGSKWLTVVPVLQVYALSVVPRFLTYVVGTTIDAVGAIDRKLYVQAGSLALAIVLILLAMPHGLVAVAWAVVILEWVRLAALLAVVISALPLGWRQWAMVPAPIAAVGLASFSGVALALALMPAHAPGWQSLTVGCLAATLGAAAGLAGSRAVLARMEGMQWASNRSGLVRRLLPR